MRILFVAPYLPSLVRIRPFNIIKYLSQNHEVTVLALTHDESDAEDASFLGRYCTRVLTVRLRKTRALMNCARAIPTRTPLQAAYCWSNDLDRLVKAELQRKSYDLVHIEHLRGAHFRRNISGLPVVYDAVDCISLLLARTLRYGKPGIRKVVSWWELRRTLRYEAELLKQFNTVLVTSEDDRRALLELRSGQDEAKIRVVPIGVHLAHSASSNEDRDPDAIVFSGKMSYHANVDAIMYFCRSIFPLIKQVRPKTKLTIVGSNPPGQVRRLARDPSITVTGHVADVRPYLERATVAVCSVRYSVGIQNKVLEAMAMGTPVVVTPQACRALRAVPGRDLLSADTAEAFAAHVVQLLENGTLRAWISNNARRYVEENHEWSRIVEGVEHLYQEVLHSALQVDGFTDRASFQVIRSQMESPTNLGAQDD